MKKGAMNLLVFYGRAVSLVALAIYSLGVQIEMLLHRPYAITLSIDSRFPLDFIIPIGALLFLAMPSGVYERPPRVKALEDHFEERKLCAPCMNHDHQLCFGRCGCGCFRRGGSRPGSFDVQSREPDSRPREVGM